MNILKSTICVLCGILLHGGVADVSGARPPSVDIDDDDQMRGVIVEELLGLYGPNGRAYCNAGQMIDRETTGVNLRVLMVTLGTLCDRVGKLWEDYEWMRVRMGGVTLDDVRKGAACLVCAIQSPYHEIRYIRAQADTLQRAITAYGRNIPGLNAHPKLMSQMSDAGMLSQYLTILAQVFAGATGQFEISTKLFLRIDPDTDIEQYDMAALEWLLMHGKLPPLRRAGESPQKLEED
jgi:hypothetical protein